MINYIIDENSSGQRMDRVLQKFFPETSRGFMQKMLRKKRIKRNGKRANASDLVCQGDELSFYFSEETYQAFRGLKKAVPILDPSSAKPLLAMVGDPLFSNDTLLVLNKPAGWLTQPDSSGKPSVSDAIRQVIPSAGTFHPAPANRLDVGTSGIILVPKTYPAQREILAAIRERHVIKDYLALVEGEVRHSGHLKDHLVKNDMANKMESNTQGSLAELDYKPIAHSHGTTLLSVRLHTGRSHQIRVQLAQAGLPIVGDYKYGNPTLNRKFTRDFNLDHPLLHSQHYAIADLKIDVTAPIPDDFRNILTALEYRVHY